MKTLKRHVSYIALFSALVLFAFTFAMGMKPVQAASAGTTGVSFSKNSVTVGDSVSVTVTGSGIDQMRVQFTGSVLELTGCSASGYTLNGTTVSFMGDHATLSFNAKKAGNAEIIVSANVLSGSSAVMTVSDPATENQDDTNTQTDNTTNATDNSAAAAAPDASANANVITIGDTKYQLSDPSSLPTDLLQKTDVKIGDQTYPGYALKGASDGFYYFYAAAGDDAPAWYQYNSGDGTMTRANEDALALTGKSDSSSGNTAKSDAKTAKSGTSALSNLKNKVANASREQKQTALIIVCAIIAVILILMIIHNIRKGREEDRLEEEELANNLTSDNSDLFAHHTLADVENDDDDSGDDAEAENGDNPSEEADTAGENDDASDEDRIADDAGHTPDENTSTEGREEIPNGEIPADGAENVSNEEAPADGAENVPTGETPADGIENTSEAQNDSKDTADDQAEDIETSSTENADITADNISAAGNEEHSETDSIDANPTDNISSMEEKLTENLQSDLTAESNAVRPDITSSDEDSVAEKSDTAEKAEGTEENPETPDISDHGEGDTSESSDETADSDDEDSASGEIENTEDIGNTGKKKKKHHFFRRKETDFWDDDDAVDPIETSQKDFEKIKRAAENRKEKLENDDDFMDLNDF